MDNTAVFYTVNVGSIPARRTKLKKAFKFYCESGEMVYSGDLKSPAERHAGSSPASRTTKKIDYCGYNNTSSWVPMIGSRPMTKFVTMSLSDTFPCKALLLLTMATSAFLPIP